MTFLYIKLYNINHIKINTSEEYSSEVELYFRSFSLNRFRVEVVNSGGTLTFFGVL